MRQYTRLNIITTFIITAIALILMIISMAYVVYADNSVDGTIPKARDLVSIYFLQMCMGSIENEVDEQSNDLTDFGSISCRFAEKLNVNVYAELNGKYIYSTDGIAKKYFIDGFSKIRKEWLEAGADFLLVDDDVTLLSESVIREDGNIITIYLRSAGGRTETSLGKIFSKMNSFHFTLLVILAIFVIMVFYIFVVNRLSKDIETPISMITQGLLDTREGNFERKEGLNFDIIEFNDIYADFENTKDKLKKAQEEEREKKERTARIVSSLAHDSGTAITSIKGYTMGLMENVANTPEKRDRYYSAIFRSVNVIERLTQDIRTIFQYDSLELQTDIEPVPIVALTKACVNEFDTPVDYGKKVQFCRVHYNCGNDVFVNVDQFRMRMAFLNIVNNSYKYRDAMKEDSFVRITVADCEDTVRIIFADNGKGVNEEDIPHLFEIFYRTDEARSHVENGSGIGLAIVKSTINQFGGEIKAECNQMGGLTLIVSLPKYRNELLEAELLEDQKNSENNNRK